MNPGEDFRDRALREHRRSTASPLCCSNHLLRGVAEAALHCAHRATIIHLNDLPKFVCFFSREGGPFDLPLRASNEGLLRPRVARAQEGCANGPALPPSALRARRAPGYSPSPLLTVRPSTDYPLDVELPDLKDDPYLKLLRPLVETYLAFWRIDTRHIKSLRLTPSQFDVIATLGDTEGMTCSELSAQTLVTKGTLTGVLDRLVSKGLIRRDAMKKRSPLHQDFVNRERRCAFSKDLCSPPGLSTSIL